MYSSVLTVLATASVASAATRGFNYGATTQSGAVKVEADFTAGFKAAQGLANTNGAFASARLYTTIQGGSTNDPISAIPAAIATNTTLFLGMWASSGSVTIANEIAALKNAITKYGSSFTDLVTGISVGSEDLYRISSTGLKNDPNGVGAQPAQIISYVKAVKSAIAGTALSGTPVGHVDTWDVWQNGTNAGVIAELDFLGMNTFPYFQTTQDNSIANGPELFNAAYDITKKAAGSKKVIITETGWPVSGKTSGAAVPSTTNAKSYYDAVGCNTLFGVLDTYWYTLVDENTDTANQPEFGVLGTSLGGTTPLFNLSCPAKSSSSSSSATSTATRTGSSGSSATGSSGSTASGSAGATGSSGSATSAAVAPGATVASSGTSPSSNGTVSGTAPGMSISSTDSSPPSSTRPSAAITPTSSSMTAGVVVPQLPQASTVTATPAGPSSIFTTVVVQRPTPAVSNTVSSAAASSTVFTGSAATMGVGQMMVGALGGLAAVLAIF